MFWLNSSPNWRWLNIPKSTTRQLSIPLCMSCCRRRCCCEGYLCARSVSCASSWTCAGSGSSRSPDSVHRCSGGPWLVQRQHLLNLLYGSLTTQAWPGPWRKPHVLNCPSLLTRARLVLPSWWYSEVHTPAALLSFYFSPSPVSQLSFPPSLFHLLLSLFRSSVDSISTLSVAGEERRWSRMWKRRRGLAEERDSCFYMILNLHKETTF